jgi:hypothetical protein
MQYINTLLSDMRKVTCAGRVENKKNDEDYGGLGRDAVKSGKGGAKFSGRSSGMNLQVTRWETESCSKMLVNYLPAYTASSLTSQATGLLPAHETVQVLMLAASTLSVRFIPTETQAVKTHLTGAIILEPTY